MKATFSESYEEYETSFRSDVPDTLRDFPPSRFEQFARRLLMACALAEVKVSKTSCAGDTDGYGNLRLGLATMNVALLCKRRRGIVGRPTGNRFRAAPQDEFEQGIFSTISNFTPEAMSASLKKGVASIILLNGASIVPSIIEKGFAVERVPLHYLIGTSTGLGRRGNHGRLKSEKSMFRPSAP
ncbi:MAG: restriction endonuclease [Bacteroidota bacterium]|nr:restriction endonuclease [Bacteroidota bacterium]